MLTFPKGFLWGTASASHQVEGDNRNNQWWEFEQRPGVIWRGDRSGLACDWWHNTDGHRDGDFDRMADLHQNAHRLSIEWSRIEPEPGRFDPAAIDRYRAMLGGLRDRGIRPLVTLHHFSDPIWFVKMGGWESSDSPFLFRRYVDYAIMGLRDLCDFWFTINEPMVFAAQGWARGIFPPGKQNILAAVKVVKHQLLAHGLAYQIIHERQPDAQVGYAKHVRLFNGQRDGNQLDRYAAGLKRWIFEHVWVMATWDGRIRPPVGWGQPFGPLERSMDFLGLNYYTVDQTRFSLNPANLFGTESFRPNSELSDSGRDGPFAEYRPDGLYQVCQEVRQFNLPVYITENGMPDQDDDQRPRWLLAHLHQLHQAIQSGVDVRGYFHWTLVDNFEWAEGWGLRFGLFELDPITQVRTARPSAQLYGEIAGQNGLTPAMFARFAPDEQGIFPATAP